jgi:MFS transporter, FHS family, L-fucose permease
MRLFNNNITKTAVAALFFLFFLWGALTCLNTIIIPHLEKLFVFKNTGTFGFANAFFGSYLIMALPSAYLIRTIHYKKSILLGLLISALGTILFIFASKYVSYAIFITGFVILASGITLIQVAANTYASIVGDAKYASARLSLAQAINSSGYVLVLAITFNPLFTGQESIVDNARNIQEPYLIITIFVILVSLLYTRLHLPRNKEDVHDTTISGISRKPGLYIAAAAIFFYVGAELTVSRIIQFTYSGIYSNTLITIMLLCYWGGMMLGRFGGYALFRFVSPTLVIQVNGLTSISILFISILVPTPVMIWLLIILGLFNAVMFPALFSEGLHQSGNPSCFNGAILIMAISGGAFIPALHERWTAHSGWPVSILMLIVCYLFIASAGYYLQKNKEVVKMY